VNKTEIWACQALYKKLCCCRESQSYCTVSNSRPPCWRWLFQSWKFWQFGCSQYIFYVIAGWHQRLWFKRWEVWGEECRGWQL